MPAQNTISDEAPGPDYSHLDKDPPVVKLRPSQTTNPSTQQPDSRSTTSTTRPTRHDSQDVKSHPPNEREPRKPQNDLNRELPDASSTTTTTKQRDPPPSTADHHEARSGLNSEAISDGDSDLSRCSGDDEHIARRSAPREREHSSKPRSTTRVPLTSQSAASYAQPARSSKDPQHPPAVAEGTAARGGAAYPSDRPRPTNAQVPPGHIPEDEQQDPSRMLDIRQSAQGPGYGQGIMDAIMSVMPSTGPSPPKDKYQLLKEEYRRTRDELKQAYVTIDNYDRELRKKAGESRHLSHYIEQLHHEKQRSKDLVGSLQNELNNVHQQLEDAKNLSEVRGKELFGAQVFLTKADTLSISEVGEKVTALNEEIFQAAATLGEALIHKRHEVSFQGELDAAAAESQEMVGEKITNLLITQSQKPEPEVNPLLVQVVLQIFMVRFCVSKIQSWYPGDPTIGEFLTAIYSDIRSTEEQAVSGRWRALTRAHTRPSSEAWQKELYQKLWSILKIAAWIPYSPENQESFGHRLSPIFKAVDELRMAIGEKFTSADLEITSFEYDKTYDPSFMDDAYSDGRQPSSKRAPEVIIGTTGIGLAKLMAERSSKDALQFQNVIPAKIVLKSTLHEALEPVQSLGLRFKRKKKPVENTDGADHLAEGRSRPKADGNMDITQ